MYRTSIVREFEFLITNTKYGSHSFNETYLAKGSHCEVDTNANYGLGLKDCDLNTAVTFI